MIGPGKYDDLCTHVREQAGVSEQEGGAVVLVVVGGEHGNGFCCQCDMETMSRLPDMLESVAKQMRADFKRHAAS